MKRSFIVFCSLWALTISLKAQETKQDSLNEMNRRIDILTEEIEKLKLGEVSETKYQVAQGLGPAASKVYQLKKNGVSLAGYGEVTYENYSNKFQNGSPSGKTDKIDYLRNVVYMGYKFNDWILFNSEIEFEHATTGEGDEERGEVSVEFGYIDLMFNKHWNLRTGMLIAPLGVINEKHEPSTYFGTLRPQVERYIIPSTWSANGVAFYGELIPSLNYRIGLIEGLNAQNFSEEGIREGRQAGSNAMAEHLGVVGKVEYEGVQGLSMGVSFYRGKSGQALEDAQGKIDALTSLYSIHGQWAWKNIEARVLYAQTNVGQADRLSALNGVTIGSKMTGYYGVMGYDVMPLIHAKSLHYLAPFIQYERFNTQASVPSGYVKDASQDRATWVVGLSYKPHPNVAFKGDYRDNSNKAKTGVNQWNLAVNYLF